MADELLDVLRSRLAARTDTFPGIARFAVRDLTSGVQDAAAIAAGRENVTTPNDLVATFAALHQIDPMRSPR